MAGELQVMVLGLRGFPGIQGGVETHAENLYPRLRDLGCEVEVVVRAPYWSPGSVAEQQGIRFKPLWSPRVGGAEAFLHTFLGVLYAGVKRPSVLHIHAVGPAFFTPLAKLLGLRVVVTHHGPDYEREKWSRFAKWVLETGERLGMRFSDERIVISRVIGDLVRVKHQRSSVEIPNGVQIPDIPETSDTPERFGLEPGKYVLNVSRMVPEKRHLDLIRGFSEAGLDGWKLALVGALDEKDAYTRKIVDAVEHTPDVVLTGFQAGTQLAELYGNAGVFALASTHEGLPIALLEALSYGLPAVASDIPANKEVGLPTDQYFRTGDPSDMARCLESAAVRPRNEDYRNELRAWVKKKYDWQQIARSTLDVYRRVCRHS